MNFLQLSYYIAYFFLAGSTPLTAFEIFSNFPAKYQVLKYILSIETSVNIIASIAYNKLISLMVSGNLGQITNFRYLDWFATTPLLLISFTLYLQYLKNKDIYKDDDDDKTDENDSKNNSKNPKIDIDYKKIGIIVLLNMLMIIFGFLGESGKMNHILACFIGFVPFVVMFYLLWDWYGDYEKNRYIFGIFAVIWSLYGIIYFLPNTPKNISYNILDIIAKVGFGLLVWFEVVKLRLENKISENVNL